LADTGNFQALCTSADEAAAPEKYFDTEEEATTWAKAAIKAAKYGQVVVRRKNEGGEWDTEPVSTHTASR
jgi:hypothetical protein